MRSLGRAAAIRGKPDARRSLIVWLAITACGPIHDRNPERDAKKAVAKRASMTRSEAEGRFVVVEKGEHGGVLVLANEKGERIGAITESAGQTIDAWPSWSPDGRFVVFASTRGRPDISFSLWMVAVTDKPEEPVQLTSGASNDWFPCWSPDGTYVVFSSNRDDKDNYDLYRLTVAKPTEIVQLTSGGGDDLQPSWSPRNDYIVYSEQVDAAHLKLLEKINARGGDPETVTNGPTDQYPTWSPDGKRIYFSAVVANRSDEDLFVVDADGSHRARVVDDKTGDEEMPRVSADGRWLFAISLIRKAGAAAVFSTLVVVDLHAKQPSLRALVDKFLQPRMGVDLGPVKLNDTGLAAAPSYDATIEDIFARARLGEGKSDQ